MGVNVLALCVKEPPETKGLRLYSYSHLIIHTYIYACESMTPCTFNTFPINSGNWSLNQVLKSHQPQDSRNLEQMRRLSWEFLTIII